MQLLHEFFEKSAGLYPDKIAVQCGESVFTYETIEKNANRLAGIFKKHGAKPDTCIAVLLPRSEWLYCSMLAILKAGAAYLPLDPETPAERIQYILNDADVKCVITTNGLASKVGNKAKTLYLEQIISEIPSQPSTRLPSDGVNSNNLCYVIYTSGTTGRPKGVMVEHRNAVSLVQTESNVYGIKQEDRVFQFASPAFDASVEEIWMAFAHGATLIAGTQDIIRSGPDFSKHLERLGVTILSCVPTFISMLDKDISTLRMLIFGGEECPPTLPARWNRPGRKIFNTYGPTEATVIATAVLLEPGKPVTIGTPISGYKVYILDESGKPVPNGEAGELCIAGTGIVRGYLGQPELTQKKFTTMIDAAGTQVRIYHSGDKARYLPDNNLEFLGRLDDQVKVRGYRIERGEIEAVLSEVPAIQAAAVDVYKATDQLAAWVVVRKGYKLDRTAVRKLLSSRLSDYMIPAFLDEIEALPYTTSGKIDRSRLPTPRTVIGEKNRNYTAPRTETEKAVVSVWQKVLKRPDISITNDFFLDLDGHSLLAAMIVSELRQNEAFSHISVGDIYNASTVEKLSSLLGKKKYTDKKVSEKTDNFQQVSRLAYKFCSIGQAFGVLVLCGINITQWLGAFLIYGYLAVADWPVKTCLIIAVIVLFLITPFTLILSIILKWVLLGKIKPGKYPLWGWFYFRYWFVRAVVRAAPVHYLDGTPFLNLYYRLMGAKIGRDVYIASHGLASFDLLTVGDGSSIGLNSSVDGTSVYNGILHLSPVTIGARCYVGNRCVLGGDNVMADGSSLDDLSVLASGERIPEGEVWNGSPSKSVGKRTMETARKPWNKRAWLIYGFGIFLFPLVITAAVMPGIMVITSLGHAAEGYSFLLAAPLIAVSFVVFLGVELWLCKWLFIGRLKPGRYPIKSFWYVKSWFFNQLMTMSTDVTESLYETLYAAPWLRSLGARIGKRVEIAAVELIQPDLIILGNESMIADLALIGAPEVNDGWVTIDEVKTGKRVFLGNSAVIPSGTTLEDNVLIGLMSKPPDNDGKSVPAGTSWFGSPAIAMPQRYLSGDFGESRTYRPPRKLVAMRLFIELFRVFLPSTIFIIFASLIITATDILQDYIHFKHWLLLLPFLYAIAGVLGIGVTALLKWIVVGRYRPGERPLWSTFVWRNDLVNAVYSNFCEHFFLTMLRGTPFISWALRFFGMRIGKRCYIDSTWYTEFDLIDVGDDVSLNENANLQTHLFEDRIIKMGPVSIASQTSVGSMSTVLYNCRMEKGSILDDLSLMMKGEELPANTRWQGIPAESLKTEDSNE
jgi:non-ribosomal peptide synthetase-like protein